MSITPNTVVAIGAISSPARAAATIRQSWASLRLITLTYRYSHKYDWKYNITRICVSFEFYGLMERQPPRAKRDETVGLGVRLGVAIIPGCQPAGSNRY